MTTCDHIHSNRPATRRPAGVDVSSPRTALLLGFVAWAAVVVLTQATAPAVVALVPALVAAGSDVRDRTVPDRWVVATAVLAVAGAIIGAGADGLVAAAVGAAAVGLPHLVVHLAAPTRLGFGDVKLAAAFGAIVGPAGSAIGEQVLLGMLLVSGAACAGLVLAAASRRRSVPLAPALVIATIAVLLVADRLGAVPA